MWFVYLRLPLCAKPYLSLKFLVKLLFYSLQLKDFTPLMFMTCKIQIFHLLLWKILFFHNFIFECLFLTVWDASPKQVFKNAHFCVNSICTNNIFGHFWNRLFDQRNIEKLSRSLKIRLVVVTIKYTLERPVSIQSLNSMKWSKYPLLLEGKYSKI